MRTYLTEALLTKIMEWESSEISKERPLLQALSSFKYDEYLQFSPGIRFIESLAKWLEQFNTIDERRIAYSFIKTQLVFISNDQMSHLVNMTFTDKINPILIKLTADKMGISKFLVNKIVNSKDYSELLRRSLFLGLSDGARIDSLRRSKSSISNEQVFPSYHISENKASDMIHELKKDNHEGKFNTIFLVDDFTASGKSYFRKEDEIYKGKIHAFLESIYLKKEKHLDSLFDLSGVFNVHVIFYLATEQAIETIKIAMEEFVASVDKKINPNVHAVQLIEKEIRDEVIAKNDFINLISKEDYFDSDIQDSHYERGDCTMPYLGFNGCGLPVVLSHNTPNNSLPILWFSEDSRCEGLFPRVTRHKDE